MEKAVFCETRAACCMECVTLDDGVSSSAARRSVSSTRAVAIGSSARARLPIPAADRRGIPTGQWRRRAPAQPTAGCWPHRPSPVPAPLPEPVPSPPRRGRPRRRLPLGLDSHRTRSIAAGPPAHAYASRPRRRLFSTLSRFRKPGISCFLADPMPPRAPAPTPRTFHVRAPPIVRAPSDGEVRPRSTPRPMVPHRCSVPMTGLMNPQAGCPLPQAPVPDPLQAVARPSSGPVPHRTRSEARLYFS